VEEDFGFLVAIGPFKRAECGHWIRKSNIMQLNRPMNVTILYTPKEMAHRIRREWDRPMAQARKKSSS